MKKLFYVLFISGMFFAAMAQDTIFFSIGAVCQGQGAVSLGERVVLEGTTYTVEPWTLPANYAAAQPLYNALVGSSFQLEDGAINENIKINWYVYDINCNTGGYIPPPGGARVLFNGYFIVSVKNASGNWEEVQTNYNFLNNKKARIQLLNSTGFQFFRLDIPLYTSDINFVFQNLGGGFTGAGITFTPPADTMNPTQYWTIEAEHFSQIIGGEKSKLTGVDDNNGVLPSAFGLSQNYPNPFNPSTMITYSLPERADVELNVYNILGVKISTLVKGTKDAGNHSINFNASKLASGLYIYELKTNKFSQSRKMLYLK